MGFQLVAQAEAIFADASEKSVYLVELSIPSLRRGAFMKGGLHAAAPSII
jgi:hypothetical protein